MRVESIFTVLLATVKFDSAQKYTCGLDNSPVTTVYEGAADIRTYPWMGVLIYSIDDDPVITTVILITKQLVMSAALDIERYPKDDFREKSKVVLGHNCTGPRIGILDYSYYPDYAKFTFSAPTIIQLNTNDLKQELRAICQPPKLFLEGDDIYAMTLSHVCNDSMISIYRMEYVSLEECKDFYRITDLDEAGMWPTHTACARSLHGRRGACLWQTGAALVVRQGNRWKLLGFGIHGPGCDAPARFLDYSVYQQWVKRSLAKIGTATITRVAPNRIILRRSLKTIPRYGDCDPEETKFEMFSDTTTIIYPKVFTFGEEKFAYYNLSLAANVDYNCVTLELYHMARMNYTPWIHLTRICTNPLPVGCSDFNLIYIDFAVTIVFTSTISYVIRAYGQEIKLLDAKKFMAFTNQRKKHPILQPGFGRNTHCMKEVINVILLIELWYFLNVFTRNKISVRKFIRSLKQVRMVKSVEETFIRALLYKDMATSLATISKQLY